MSRYCPQREPKGKPVKIPVLESEVVLGLPPLGMCLRQLNWKWKREEKALAEISFLLKKVKRGVHQIALALGVPLKWPANHFCSLTCVISFKYDRPFVCRECPSHLPWKFTGFYHFPFQSYPIRIRWSRLIASSLEHNVCKGSRQTGSVRSQERVAHAVGKFGGYEQAHFWEFAKEGGGLERVSCRLLLIPYLKLLMLGMAFASSLSPASINN
jgi:hypothetical protein